MCVVKRNQSSVAKEITEILKKHYADPDAAIYYQFLSCG